MGQLGVLAAVATVIAFNALIWLGVLGKDPTRWFQLTLGIIEVALPLSSALMAWLLMRRGQRTAALLFASNLALVVIVVALRLGGIMLRREYLFGLDLYVLNLYLILLARHGARVLQSAPMQPTRAGS